MAHYHYTPRFVMEELTLGQVYALFEGAMDYVMLTNPWGSGEEEKADEPAPTREDISSLNQPGSAAAAMVGAGMLQSVTVRPRDSVPEANRDIVEKLLNG